MKSNKITYKEKLLDPRWQRLRLEVFERDQWKCRCCGSLDKTLHAHHTYYFADAEGPWDYEASTIISLCHECHSVEHEDFYGVRNRLINTIIRLGFLTADQMEWLACHLDAGTLDKDGADEFMRTIGAALRSRAGRELGVDDGAAWDKFAAIGKGDV